MVNNPALVNLYNSNLSFLLQIIKTSFIPGELTVYILHANSNIVHYLQFYLLSILSIIVILFLSTGLLSSLPIRNLSFSVDMNNSCLFPGVKELIRTFWNWKNRNGILTRAVFRSQFSSLLPNGEFISQIKLITPHPPFVKVNNNERPLRSEYCLSL